VPSSECKSFATIAEIPFQKETSLLGWVSLDFVRTGLSNMHLCCTLPYALAGLFLFITSELHQSITKVASWHFGMPIKSIVALKNLLQKISSLPVHHVFFALACAAMLQKFISYLLMEKKCWKVIRDPLGNQHSPMH